MSANVIINFFENYGLIMTLLATSGIVFVGTLKAIGLFSKLNPKIKKYVYFACSCITSIVSCTIYLCIIDAFVWADWGMITACVIGYTISIYGLYENMGIRMLLKKLFFSPIKNLLQSIPSMLASKGMTEEKILILAKNLGSDILLQLANEIKHEEIISTPKQNEKVQSTNIARDTDKTTEKTTNEFNNNNFFS